MYKATTIANEIVRQCHQQSFSVSNLKLQKLLYFVQAYALAEFDEPAFDDRIEAWEYGPVVPNVYQFFKIYGPNPIPLKHYFSDIDKPERELLTENILTAISSILTQLGKVNAFSLVDLSHEEGSPWHSVYKPLISGAEIPNALIKEYYSE
jgi:uncharacterized phage-associated protein